MPNFNVGIWNIQDFGDAAPRRRGQDGTTTASVICALVRDFALDVLVVLEAKPGALPSLRKVLGRLNQGLPQGDDDWCFDWVKSAIRNDPPTGPADLTWKGGRTAPTRQEGTAVFFRANRPAFDAVPAFVNMSEGTWRSARWSPLNGESHFVELSRKGRLFDYTSDQNWRPGGGYNPATNALLPLDAQGAPLDEWPDSQYPYVTRGMFAEPRRRYSRRPAFLMTDLQNGGDTAARLCPILGYHAPSNALRAQMGTNISGLARELYVVHDLLGNGHQDPARYVHNANFVAGGDYNLNARRPSAHPENYSNYTNAYSNNANSGAAGTSLLPIGATASKTTVQLNAPLNGHYAGPPIQSNDLNAYLFGSIDQAFYRGVTLSGGSGVVDLMTEVMDQNSAYVAAIRSFGPFFDQIVHESGNVPDPQTGPVENGDPVYGGKITDWVTFRAGIGNGFFTTARSAAEFLHIFVSDHLPLALRFNWP